MSTMTDGYKANELRKRARELLAQADILDPPEEAKDWRVVGPWGTEEEALEDLATLPLVGFAHYEMEKKV